jgi:hypothetical protein
MDELIKKQYEEARMRAEFLTQQTVSLESQLKQATSQMQQAVGAVRALEALMQSLAKATPPAGTAVAAALNRNGAAPAVPAGRAGS